SGGTCCAGNPETSQWSGCSPRTPASIDLGIYPGAVTTTAPRLRPSLKGKGPGLSFERALWDAGASIVVGVDEVGRGAWAGPLTVGAAVVPRDRRVYKIRDSKMLTETEREALFERVARSEERRVGKEVGEWWVE